MQTWANDLDRHVSHKGVKMAKTHMKKCSTSLTVTDLGMKTTMMYHLEHARMVIVNNSINSKE